MRCFLSCQPIRAIDLPLNRTVRLPSEASSVVIHLESLTVRGLLAFMILVSVHRRRN